MSKSIMLTILLVSCAILSGSFWYQLNDTKKQLANIEVQLADTVIELDTTKTLLDTTKTQLVNTETQLGATRAELDVTKNQLAMTTTQLETAKNEKSQILDQYADLRKQINVRLGLTPQGRQSFVTPSNLSVFAKVQEITGGYSENVNEYWMDYDRLYRWVVTNISYSHDSYIPSLPENISGELTWQRSYWRLPDETLVDKTGDCEDMAVLLASMLRNYNEPNYRVWILIIYSTATESAHAAVAFPVDGERLTILDPAGKYYTGYPYGALGSENAPVAVSNWLSHWKKEMPGAEIIEGFSENSYNEFSGTDEFLSWLQE
ncbi:transglutaminase-like domain-containing protein [Chloroflexota bacterium]